MKRVLVMLFVLILLVCACTPGNVQPPLTSSSAGVSDIFPREQDVFAPEDDPILQENDTASHNPQPSESSAPPALPDGAELKVIFFDVGQADGILIKTDDNAMLVDAGDIGQDSLILEYLSEYRVTALDIMVATHPHADHIGNAAAVIESMDNIGTLLMPDAIHTTTTFEQLLDAIEENNIDVTVPQAGDTFSLGHAKIQILAPNGLDYEELNDYCIVLRIDFGNTSFLLTGDAEAISENEQLASGFDLSADVLKVGHHGSDSSTITQYLAAVSPRFAVISCGKDNSYGHPSNAVLTSLSDIGAEVYRTDEYGTVEITTDGETISISPGHVNGGVQESPTETKATSEPEGSKPTEAPSGNTYIGNKNSKVFHLPTCRTLPAEKNRVYFDTRDDAVSSGYQACNNCNP